MKRTFYYLLALFIVIGSALQATSGNLDTIAGPDAGKSLILTGTHFFGPDQYARGDITFLYGFSFSQPAGAFSDTPTPGNGAPVRLRTTGTVDGVMDLRTGNVILDNDLHLGDCQIIGAQEWNHQNSVPLPPFAHRRKYCGNHFNNEWVNVDGCGCIQLNGHTLHLSHNLTMTSGYLVFESKIVGDEGAWNSSSPIEGIIDGHGNTIDLNGGVIAFNGARNNSLTANKTIIIRNVTFNNANSRSFEFYGCSAFIFENVTFRITTDQTVSDLFLAVEPQDFMHFRYNVNFIANNPNATASFFNSDWGASSGAVFTTEANTKVYFGPSIQVSTSLSMDWAFVDKTSEMILDNCNFYIIGPGSQTFTKGILRINGRTGIIGTGSLSLGDGINQNNDFDLTINSAASLILDLQGSNKLIINNVR